MNFSNNYRFEQKQWVFFHYLTIKYTWNQFYYNSFINYNTFFVVDEQFKRLTIRIKNSKKYENEAMMRIFNIGILLLNLSCLHFEKIKAIYFLNFFLFWINNFIDEKIYLKMQYIGIIIFGNISWDVYNIRAFIFFDNGYNKIILKVINKIKSSL